MNPISYEQLMQQLKQIIEDFQKGNMQLSQAVEKYNACSKLIEECNKMLNNACVIETEKAQNQSLEMTNVNFEDNMKVLEEMTLKLNNSKDITLDELTKISTQSREKIAQCEFVLGNFQNMIEYTKQ